MLSVQSFSFNPFQENTYILYNEFGECIIIDPGMHNAPEEMLLSGFIASRQLKPLLLLNTHCHIDHILGNLYCVEKYKLSLQCHINELQVLHRGKASAEMYGLKYAESPEPASFLSENSIIPFGKDELKVLFTPGHSPGSICFYCAQDNFVIAGDTLFFQSIGRTDLPGGDHDTLINCIKKELLTLPVETKVYSGHGAITNVGYEKEFNPFLV